MPTFRKLEDIRAWHLARGLTKEIYEASALRPDWRDTDLRNQIRSASVSIISNISEGFARGGNREFLYFLSVAKGSAGEVVGQLYIALDQRYIPVLTFCRLKYKTNQLIVMLEKLISYLSRSGFRGHKFKYVRQRPTRRSIL